MYSMVRRGRIATVFVAELEEDVRLSQGELGLISWAPSSLGLIMHCKEI